MRHTMTLLAMFALGGCGTAGTNGTPGPTGLPGPEGAAGAQGAMGEMGMNAPPIVISERAKQGLDISPAALNLTGLSTAQVEQLGMGSYLVNAVGGCADCHDSPGTQKFLAGGTSFALDGAGHAVVARNLTPDAQSGMKLTQDEFVEAMRTGKDFRSSGEGMVVMPWPVLRWMSTSDLKAMYAYLKAIPAVANATTADNKGPFAGAPVAFPTSYGDGDVTRPLPAEQDQNGGAIPDPSFVRRGMAIQPLDEPADLGTLPSQDQIAFGRGSYLVNAVAGCNDCHTNPDRSFAPGATFLKINTDAYLAGGRVFTVPPPLAVLTHQKRSMGTNLIGMNNGFIGEASFATFAAIIQTGTHADDPQPAPLAFPMPASRYRNMVLEDLAAIYTYLRHVPSRTGANDKATQEATVSCAVNADCDTAAGETCDATAKECVGKACADDSECTVCQTCTGSNVCAAPAAASTCLTMGI